MATTVWTLRSRSRVQRRVSEALGDARYGKLVEAGFPEGDKLRGFLGRLADKVLPRPATHAMVTPSKAGACGLRVIDSI